MCRVLLPAKPGSIDARILAQRHSGFAAVRRGNQAQVAVEFFRRKMLLLVTGRAARLTG